MAFGDIEELKLGAHEMYVLKVLNRFQVLSFLFLLSR